jgi:ubiquinone/menaquinone biosynthesis C-methylase UbiE
MYHYLAARAQVAGKDVLEVGSGRGGGLRHVAETMHTGSATGLDFAASAIAFCQKNHAGTSVRYIEGNSMDMPFESESFDVVLNVESCHAYRDQAQFLREVVRVLRPGGTLHLVDVRALWNWDLLYQWLNEAGLELIENVDISPNVVTAIERDEPTKKALIKKRVPFWLRGMFTEFAGNVGSQLYERLNNGEIQYRRIVARRPA